MIQFFREVKPNRKVMGSSIKEEPLPFLVRFRKPMKVVVTYEGGWKRVAEDVVEIQQGRRDVIFLRRYPGAAHTKTGGSLPSMYGPLTRSPSGITTSLDIEQALNRGGSERARSFLPLPSPR